MNSETRTPILIGASLVAMMSIMLIAFDEAYGELDFEIEPYYEGNGFGMGYAYKCGAEYQYAEGLTVLTIQKTPNFNDYVSILAYYFINYDEYGNFSDYELYQSTEYYGNAEVMESIQMYWSDRNVSSFC